MRSDDETLAALRRGDEQVFVELVQQHQALMLRVASRYVRSRTLAEEVVQETWLGVLNGLDRFEGRASMKTWIFRILINRAITRAQREGRTVPFSSLGDDGADEPAVDPDRFRARGRPLPRRLEALPRPAAEQRLLERETLAMIDAAIGELPDRQQLVIVMRDIEGWSRRGGLRVAGDQRGQPAGTAAPCPLKVRSCLESYLNPAAVLT